MTKTSAARQARRALAAASAAADEQPAQGDLGQTSLSLEGGQTAGEPNPAEATRLLISLVNRVSENVDSLQKVVLSLEQRLCRLEKVCQESLPPLHSQVPAGHPGPPVLQCHDPVGHPGPPALQIHDPVGHSGPGSSQNEDDSDEGHLHPEDRKLFYQMMAEDPDLYGAEVAAVCKSDLMKEAQDNAKINKKIKQRRKRATHRAAKFRSGQLDNSGQYVSGGFVSTPCDKAVHIFVCTPCVKAEHIFGGVHGYFITSVCDVCGGSSCVCSCILTYAYDHAAQFVPDDDEFAVGAPEGHAQRITK